MSLDIRAPIGLLFLSLGGLLAGFGLVTQFTSPAIYEKSLDVNVNLWWGLVMLVFGGAMFYAGRGAGPKAEGIAPEDRDLAVPSH